jgi:hypothetical protein
VFDKPNEAADYRVAIPDRDGAKSCLYQINAGGVQYIFSVELFIAYKAFSRRYPKVPALILSFSQNIRQLGRKTNQVLHSQLYACGAGINVSIAALGETSCKALWVLISALTMPSFLSGTVYEVTVRFGRKQV